MAMIWDAVLVSALAEELKTLLRGARLRGHRFRWEEREISLFFDEGTLRWQLHPGKGWLTFSVNPELPEGARPLSAHLLDVTAPPDERLLELRFRRGRGRSRDFRLVVELLTNQWNALFLEGSEGRIRHLLWTRRLEDRTLAIGQPYRPPVPSKRRGIHGSLKGEEWNALVQGKTPEEARRILLDEVAFTSPVNVEWLMSGEAPSSEPGPLGLRRWEELRNPTYGQSCVLEFTRYKQPYPIVLNNFNHTHFSSLLTAIEAASLDQAGDSDPGDEARNTLEKALQRARNRARGIRREMAQAGDPEEPRDQATLILARLGAVPRGAESVSLEGFEGEEVRIQLDPTLTPQENAQALYQEAARRERARNRLPPLLERAEGAILELERLREALEGGSLSPAEVSWRIPGRRPAPGSERKQETRSPFRRYWSSGGLEIRVGRSSRENDLLTFRHSHPKDIWLHARDRAGAHVILRWREEGNPPHRDLAEAAVLAAVFSGARTSGTVPVDWTRRKYVRKPRKAQPGTVVPERARTLFVHPDPELPQRLRREEEGS